ncbi:ATP-dependent helicase HrpB [Marinivivus vitaminiproducens]|uniref:ATP-dependent helicase HrpB n=1 Tax=Marinivivus vitaminiproducens TaxID=3035935 RepID=UPI0027A6EC76|nr:ATP-dependent helicase HrpB [Geminicoccaceae bacterium SCSIO 64248]
MSHLPIHAILPDVLAIVARTNRLLLQAPPGAGKTTGVPLALRDESWLGGQRIVMLEPRRLAARAAAVRMAETLGEPVGQTVGYRIRGERAVGRNTRIEVVTDGILTRMLQDEPGLDGVGCLILDEFHERSLQADLGLALALESQAALRPDLRILLMSATLDAAPIAARLGGIDVLTSEGRSFPVETRHRPPPAGRTALETAPAAVREALAETEGDLLVFLPGEAEIRRLERTLDGIGSGEGIEIRPLFGALGFEAQRRALAPASPGRRRIILATALAETSLTIPGVRVVIDLGLARRPRFDPASGMTRLVTERASQASAVQRRGRAGRTTPGWCWRLWPEAETRGRPAFDVPEIVTGDLAPLALELALWGARTPDALTWLDPPPAASYASARDLLARLGLIDPSGAATDKGREAARLGLHPRLARMALDGRAIGAIGLAADLAALLEERDFLRASDGEAEADLGLRIDALAEPHGRSALPAGWQADPAALRRVRANASRLRRRLGGSSRLGEDRAVIGRLVALAYPDRVAQAAGRRGRFRLRNGKGAVLPPTDSLAGARWLAIAQMGGSTGDGRVWLAAELGEDDLRDLFTDDRVTARSTAWDERAGQVIARERETLGALVLSERPVPARSEDVAQAVLGAIERLGIDVLPWTPDLRGFQARVGLLARLEDGAGTWPRLDDDHLLSTLAEWLLPYLPGIDRRSAFARIDLRAALEARLDWPQRQALERLAPVRIAVPSGRAVALDYLAGDVPVLAVRLQDMFGLKETPAIAGGRLPVLLHLLSPAGRPVQVTGDLAGFWRSSYHEVRRELRGRYPKHAWPEDPSEAAPTARSRPKKSC